MLKLIFDYKVIFIAKKQTQKILSMLQWFCIGEIWVEELIKKICDKCNIKCQKIEKCAGKFVKNDWIKAWIFPRKDGKPNGQYKDKSRIRQDSQNESKKLVEMEIV